MITKIGSVPSNLRIVDYVHGFTGSTHDATAFEHSAAVKYEDWFFDGEEFFDRTQYLTHKCHFSECGLNTVSVNSRVAFSAYVGLES